MTTYVINSGFIVKIVNYSYARKNLRGVIDAVENDSEPTCIVSKNNQVVLISKSDYDTIIETRYVELQLLSKG